MWSDSALCAPLFREALADLVNQAKQYKGSSEGTAAASDESEDEVHLAMRLAGEIFQEADIDNSGSLDVEELSGIVTNLFAKMGKDLPHDYQGDALKVKVERSLLRFDADGNGTISFDEFLQMLCCAPWRAMLPPGIRENMPRLVVMGMGKGIPVMPRNKPTKMSPEDQAAEEALTVLKALFDKADEDRQGSIDNEEMAPLIRLMYKEWDNPVPHDLNNTLPETIKRCMTRFDADESGTLTFNEFLQMLTCTPWRGMMPKKIRRSIVRACELYAGAAPAQARAAKEMRSENCLAMIEALYNECDRDGSGEVDPLELNDLIYLIFERLKKPIPENFATESEGIANKAMEQFDKDRDGKITFNEFTQLLCVAPWCDLLPPAVLADLKALLGRGKEKRVRVDVSDWPIEQLLEGVGIKGCDEVFHEEGFLTIGDLLDIAFKINEQDLVSLGIKGKIQQKNLLRVIRSGDPHDFMMEANKRKIIANDMREHYARGGRRLTKEELEEARQSTSFVNEQRKPLPCSRRHASLVMPKPPKPTNVVSPCTPVRSPADKKANGKSNPVNSLKVGWNMGLPTERPANSTWEQRGTSLRIKSRLSVMDRPTYPRNVFNHGDAQVFKGYIEFDQRYAGGYN